MKKAHKELIEKAFEYGSQAFGKFICTPAVNAEFMEIVPNCSFGDDAGCKLREKLYKSYIRGWTTAHLKSMP